MLNTNLFKLINKFLKYYVVCSSVLMTIHCFLMLIGIDTWMIDLVIGLSLGGFISLLLASYLLHYCNLYRNFLFHLFLVSCCVTWHVHTGFGSMLFPFALAMFLYGLVLLIILIRNKFIL